MISTDEVPSQPGQNPASAEVIRWDQPVTLTAHSARVLTATNRVPW